MNQNLFFLLTSPLTLSQVSATTIPKGLQSFLMPWQVL